MKPKRETFIKAIAIKLRSDPSGKAAVRALDKAIKLGLLIQWEADEIFFEAEKAAYPIPESVRARHSGSVLRLGKNQGEQRYKIQKYSSYTQRREEELRGTELLSQGRVIQRLS